VISSVNNFLFDQWDKSVEDGAMPFDDRGLTELAKQRVSTMWSALYIATYRIAEMWAWMPYLLPFLIPAILDGFVKRSINKWRFFSPSPLKHQSTMVSIKVGIGIMILLPFLPIPFPVVLIPAMFVFLGCMIMLFVGNLSKHI